jgi:hypothetical protein
MASVGSGSFPGLILCESASPSSPPWRIAPATYNLARQWGRVRFRTLNPGTPTIWVETHLI